jgi:glycoprotein-N-acetylgalactosamine 3-beta-galactosyltransferase
MKRTRIPRVLAFAMTVWFGMKNILSQTLSVNTEPHIRPAVLDSPVDIAKRRNMTLFPPPNQHPFAGARDANGHWGYVADPYSLRHHILLQFRNDSGIADATFEGMLTSRYMPLIDHGEDNETEKVCQTAPGEGIEGEGGWDVLVNKIVVGGPLPLPKSKSDPREPPNGWQQGMLPKPNDPPYFNSAEPPKVFCGMYTYHKKHHLLRAATHTWAFRCDGFLAFSDLTDPTIGAVDLPHSGEENYANMWQKVRSIWAYIYTNYYDSFDYFHLGGDDTMMIVENLRNYLWSIDDDHGTKPLYLGGPYKTRGVVVCGGGPGYTLNRVALKWLATESFAKPDNRVDSGEDRLMGFTLRSFVRCYDTHDANGGMRYLGWSPKDYGKSCNEMRCGREMTSQFRFWSEYVQKNVSGVDLVSSQAVSFHLLRKPISLKRVHAILYRTCPKFTVLADALVDRHSSL